MAEGNEGVKREGYARRRLLLALPGLVCAPRAWADYPAVTRAQKLTFPRDHGAHPQHRTEWWYITGWMSDEHGGEFGVQVTFFRSRPGVQEDNPSAFAPKQLLFAHAALADTRLGRLRHDQRAAREGLGLAGADTSTTQVRIDDWSLQLTPEGYRAHIAARDFGMQLEFRPVQPILLEERRATAAKVRCRGRRAITTAGLISPSRARWPSRAAHYEPPAKLGSITNGRASTWHPRRRVGTGSGSISPTAAR